MSLSPTPRALAVVAAWVGVALLLLPAGEPGGLLAMLAGLALAVAALDAWRASREAPLEVTRILPERAQVGARVPAELRVHNPNPRRCTTVVHEAVPGEVAVASEHFVLELPAAGDATSVYELRPDRRGDLGFGHAVALVRSPMGLWWRRLPVGGDETLRVYPDAWRLLRSLDPRGTLAQLGAKPTARRGEGLEFESLRDYVPGDDPRRLDWAASARRGRPVVRQYQHEQNHSVVVALDTSRLMSARIGGRSKLDHAVDAALVLGYAGLVCGDHISLACFDRELRGFLAPRSRRGEFGALLDFLRPIEPRPVEPDYEAFVRGLAARQRQRSLVVVLTDFVEVEAAPLATALQVLARRHRVLLVALRDPLLQEIHPRQPARRHAEGDVLRRLVLADVAHHRERVLLALRRRAVQTLDLQPAEVTGETLNRYLALRRDP